ncbi:hypothetical protein GGS23DRAFT_550315, partial [Durotheca rogersii]|uniref:uncharacterized protein n=1 Tax=Durotheca rogersii TaxID=419775 RepID=UPI002220F9BE
MLSKLSLSLRLLWTCPYPLLSLSFFPLLLLVSISRSVVAPIEGDGWTDRSYPTYLSTLRTCMYSSTQDREGCRCVPKKGVAVGRTPHISGSHAGNCLSPRFCLLGAV